LCFDLYTAKEHQEIGFLKQGHKTRDKIKGPLVKVHELSIAKGQNLTGFFQKIRTELAAARLTGGSESHVPRGAKDNFERKARRNYVVASQ